MTHFLYKNSVSEFYSPTLFIIEPIHHILLEVFLTKNKIISKLYSLKALKSMNYIPIIPY